MLSFFVQLLLTLATQRDGNPPRAVVTPAVMIRSISAKRFRYEVTNAGPDKVLLISPNHPDFLIDQDRCLVEASTRIADWNASYAFTPEVTELRAGARASFEVEFDTAKLHRHRCKNRRFAVSLACIVGKDIQGIKARSGDDLRSYIQRHQRIIGSKKVTF